MSAMRMPSRPTPSIELPTLMIVAAWVICWWLSVIVVPARVVAVSESGTWPTSSAPLVMQEAIAAGDMNRMTLRSAVTGPKNSAPIATTMPFLMSHPSHRSGLSSWEMRSRRH